MLALVISLLGTLAFVNRRVAGTFLYPPAMFAALWAIYLSLYAVSGSLFFSIGDDTLFFYAWCVCAFSAGGYAVLLFSRRRRTQDFTPDITDQRRRRIHLFLDLLLLILVVGLPFYVRYILSLISDTGLVGFFITIRAKMVELSDEMLDTVSFMDNLAVLANAVPLLIYYEDDGSRARRWRTWLSLFLALIYNLLTAGRAGFVSLILALFAMHWLKEKKPNWKVLTALGLAFVITFVAIAILVRKGDVDKNASFVENLPAVADGFLWYALGGLVGFDTIYHHPTQIEANQNLDRYFRVIAKKFDNRVEVPPVHSEYVTIGPGGNMNVYTAYFSYYPQLGFLGTTLVLLLLGTSLVWIFLAAQSGNPQAAILFSVLFAGLVLTGYAENLLLNLNFLAKIFFVTWLMYRFRLHPRPLRYAASTASLA